MKPRIVKAIQVDICKDFMETSVAYNLKWAERIELLITYLLNELHIMLENHADPRDIKVIVEQYIIPSLVDGLEELLYKHAQDEKIRNHK